MSQYVRLAGAVRPSEKGERGKMGEEKRSLRRENVKPVLTFRGVFSDVQCGLWTLNIYHCSKKDNPGCLKVFLKKGLVQ